MLTKGEIAAVSGARNHLYEGKGHGGLHNTINFTQQLRNLCGKDESSAGKQTFPKTYDEIPFYDINLGIPQDKHYKCYPNLSLQKQKAWGN